MKKDNAKIKIQLPNLLLIPIFSILNIIIKLFGGMDNTSWIDAIVFHPFMEYFLWTMMLLSIMLMCILIRKASGGK